MHIWSEKFTISFLGYKLQCQSLMVPSTARAAKPRGFNHGMEAGRTSRSQPRWTVHSKGSARDQANTAWLSKSLKEAVAYSENKDMEKV